MYLAATDVSDSTFMTYVIALGISGILLLVVAAIGFGATTGSRVVSALFGLAFLGYATYLEFFFEGGEFRIFIYAFIVPILVIVNLFRSRKAKAEAAAAVPAAPTPPPAA